LLEVFLDQPKTECNRIHLFSRGNYGGFHHDGVQGFLEEMDALAALTSSNRQSSMLFC
jgi:hypothetical protein